MLENFKKVVAMFMLLVMVTNALSTVAYGAQTSDTELEMADALNAIGLFAGTNIGYELDRVATRIEAATMMVRILGKEAEAKSSKYEHPFTDVPVWANDYVGYMYHNQLSLGIGNNLFGSSQKVTGDTYMTFMLRALGYKDSQGDFSHIAALSFAVDQGIISAIEKASLGAESFLRAGLVVISYRSLQANIKGQTSHLIDQLINDGVVEPLEGVLQGIAEAKTYGDSLNPEMIYTGTITDVDLSQETFHLEEGEITIRNHMNGIYDDAYSVILSVPPFDGWDEDVIAKLTFYKGNQKVKQMFSTITDHRNVSKYSANFHFTSLADGFTSVVYEVFPANEFYRYSNWPKYEVHKISIKDKEAALTMMREASFITVNYFDEPVNDVQMFITGIAKDVNYYTTGGPYYIIWGEDSIVNGYKDTGKILSNQGSFSLFATNNKMSQLERSFSEGKQLDQYTLLVNTNQSDAFVLRDENFQVTDIIVFVD